MDNTLGAPRFEAYLKYDEKWRVLSMDRESWDSIVQEPGKLVEIDVTETPMSCVEAYVTACVGEKYADTEPSHGDGFVHIFRQDPADYPNQINTDKYKVWFGDTLTQHPDFMDIVNAATTAADANLSEHLSKRVYFVKQNPDAEHRLTDLPQKVKMVLKAE